MKQNRDIYPNYPVYPMPMPNMMPDYNSPSMMPNYGNQNMMPSYDTGKLQEEINNLKKRVTALEKTANSNYGGTKFSDTNYHMM